MSAYLESYAELEKQKVNRLLEDCPEEFNLFYNKFSKAQIDFLLEQGILSAATIWEKVIEWSGRERHETGIGADFQDGTDAKNCSIYEWKDPKFSVKRQEKYFRDRATATISGVRKQGDLLVSVYNRWHDTYDYYQIPQEEISNGTINIEYNFITKEVSSKWSKFKTELSNILCK